MKISTKSRYGLRILVEVAINTTNGISCTGRTVAKTLDLSEAYLEQIMIPLKTAGMVKTKRGCKGGYALSMDPNDITLLSVIELFEGKLTLVGCVGDASNCPKLNVCSTQAVWSELSQTLREKAASITLAQVVQQHLERTQSNDFII